MAPRYTNTVARHISGSRPYNDAERLRAHGKLQRLEVDRDEGWLSLILAIAVAFVVGLCVVL